jgi:hypothetical protein
VWKPGYHESVTRHAIGCWNSHGVRNQFKTAYGKHSFCGIRLTSPLRPASSARSQTFFACDSIHSSFAFSHPFFFRRALAPSRMCITWTGQTLPHSCACWSVTAASAGTSTVYSGGSGSGRRACPTGEACSNSARFGGADETGKRRTDCSASGPVRGRRMRLPLPLLRVPVTLPFVLLVGDGGPPPSPPMSPLFCRGKAIVSGSGVDEFEAGW